MENKLPERWEWKKLGEIGEYINGKAFKPSEWAEVGKPIVRIQNLTDPSKPFNYFDGECEEKYHLENGDILISWSASLGVFIWEGGDALLNQHIFKAIPEERIIDKGYFVYVVKTVIEEMEQLTHGSTMKHIVKSDFNDTKIPVPPLEIQQKIVAILKKAEETKKLRAQADELTQKLLQSLFLEMFGDTLRNENHWSLKKAEEICSEEKNAIKAGPFGSSLKKEFYVETGYKIYGQEQVIKDDLKYGDYYISQEKYDELENYRIQEGDILISLVGSYGKLSIVPKVFEPGIINPRLMKITLDREVILPIYFKYLFLSKGIMTQVSNLSHGGTMDIINVGIVKKLSFPVPPLPLQQKFAEIVHKIEKTTEFQKQSFFEINTLFDVLMHKAFTGELVL